MRLLGAQGQGLFNTVVLAIHGTGQKTRFVRLTEDAATQIQQLREHNDALIPWSFAAAKSENRTGASLSDCEGCCYPCWSAR